MYFKNSIRKVRFFFELYTRKGEFKKELDNIVSFKITSNYFSQIKTTAKITMTDDEDIDFMNDIIRPYIAISEPTEPEISEEKEVVFLNLVQPVETEVIFEGEYGSWEVYPLGAFFMSSPTRYDKDSTIFRSVDAYDLSLVLSEDKLTDRYTLRKGENYITAVENLIRDSGITRYDIKTPDMVTTRRDIEYEPGTSLLTVVNDMLGQIGNTPIYMDRQGVLRSEPYVNPSEREPTKQYVGGATDLKLVGAEEELDIFNVPNVFTVTVSNPDEKPITKTYVNDDVKNPLSTVRRGRRIVDFRTIEDISNEESLEKYVLRIANESNVQYGSIKFTTPLMPEHWYGEMVDFKYSPLNIEGLFLETGWEMDLKVGGEMTHTLRKIINFREERDFI